MAHVFIPVAVSTPVRAATADTGAEAVKGASLYRSCQAELRLMAPGALSEADSGDLVSGSYCVGYLGGFVANLSAPASTICPADRPMGALVRAYVDYIDQHQSYLEQDKRLGLRLALEAAFPCPASLVSPAKPEQNRLSTL